VVRAYGNAKKLKYHELARAQCQAELIMSITEGLQERTHSRDDCAQNSRKNPDGAQPLKFWILFAGPLKRMREPDVSIFEACSWLNQFDRRHRPIKALGLNCGNCAFGSSEETVARLIQTAGLCNCAIQPLERAEIQLNCRRHQFSMGLFAEADQHILDAKFIYEENRDRHRFAVAVWMAGNRLNGNDREGNGHANWDAGLRSI